MLKVGAALIFGQCLELELLLPSGSAESGSSSAICRAAETSETRALIKGNGNESPIRTIETELMPLITEQHSDHLSSL